MPATAVSALLTGSASMAGNPRRGLLLAIAAMLILPGLDAIAKALTDELPPLAIAFGRFTAQSILLTILILLIGGVGALRMRRPAVMLIPGTAMAAATVCFFGALQYLPIAEAISIFFVEPMVVTIFAAIFLGERFGWRRVIAIVVGFVGAMVVIRPNFAEVGWPALLPLATAVTFACYIISVRRLAASAGPLAIQAYTGYAATVVLGLCMLAGSLAEIPGTTPPLPSIDQLLRLLALGLIAAVGHTMVVTALRHIPANVIAPLQYLEIVSATLLGLLFFGDFPDSTTWIGIVIIVSSGIYVYQREARNRTGH